MNRTRLGALALAAAVVLLLPSVSLAQLFRGGGRWDGGWGARSWDGGWGGRTSYYFGYGRGYYPYYYGYNPSSYDYGYRSPSYTMYYQPPTSYGYESAYPTEASYGMRAPDQDTRVMARVRVPIADAHLWIEGREMTTNGLARRFVSPPLDPGQRYTYTFRAEWSENGKQVNQTREVRVHPGDRITVDFTTPEKPSGTGTRRESGYGPEGQASPTEATPSQPKPNTPPAPPERRRDNPPPDRDK